MAFGLKREELKAWKEKVSNGEIGILTHYWMDNRFPGSYTVTKVGCKDVPKLIAWGEKYGLDPTWIHQDEKYPHYDLFGEYQANILLQENQWEQIKRFNLL
ncbi:hypothetical protein [Oceanobacillus halophilus]|uniref:YneQ n=1 Tax=Oceanobacillus halophilus TaxID=930130 RepID=A0A495AC70_9BACI|nr:hypothetical protein [Oceanobacillus halophilus]RKQ37579.1 hypothetical protein D8M06_01875 [Oceanobacillus halophilus]